MNKEFFKNALIRMIKTFCQAFAAAVGVGAAVSEVDWLNALSVAAVAAVASALTSLASLDVVGEKSDDSSTESDADTSD